MASCILLGARRGPYRRGEHARNAILEAARAQPGASRSDILRLTGLSWGTVAHHVRTLTARGQLRAHEQGRRVYYYADGADPSLLPYIRLLRNEPEVMDVIRVLNRNGPYSVQRLSHELAMGRKTVRRHLGTLARAGFVGATRLPRPKYELRAIPVSLAAQMRESPAGKSL